MSSRNIDIRTGQTVEDILEKLEGLRYDDELIASYPMLNAESFQPDAGVRLIIGPKKLRYTIGKELSVKRVTGGMGYLDAVQDILDRYDEITGEKFRVIVCSTADFDARTGRQYKGSGVWCIDPEVE